MIGTLAVILGTGLVVAAGRALGLPVRTAGPLTTRTKDGYELRLVERKRETVVRTRGVGTQIGHGLGRVLVAEVHGLPSLAGVDLIVTHEFGVIEPTTRDAAFDRAFWVHSDPAHVGRAFLDDATRERFHGTDGDSLLVRGGVLRVEHQGSLAGPETLLALHDLAEALAARWLELQNQARVLVETLAFSPEPAAQPFGSGVQARAFRRGIEWTLRFVADQRDCEVRIACEHAELRFDWRTTAADVLAAFSAKESALAAKAAYR